MTAIASTVLRNVHNEAVIKIVGTGTATITVANLIVQTVRKVNTTNGSPIVTLTGVNGNDNIGVLVGGTVTGSGIPGSTTVLSISGRTVTLDKNATATASNVSLTFDSQKAVAPLVSIEKLYWSGNHANGIIIEKTVGTLLMKLYGSDHWNLNEMSILDTINNQINVTMAEDDTLIIKLKKYGDWGNGNSSYGNQ